MAKKLKDFVRNSPLNRRRGGGYAVLESEQKDPFQQGINFHAHYFGSVETNSKRDSPEVQEMVSNAWKKSEKSRFRKVVITVKSAGLSVKDARTGIKDDYPIYLVSYCGSSHTLDELFFFIHKTKLEKKLMVEFFKLSNSDKVTALTLTVAKAFNIAYKAWTVEKRQRDKDSSRGSESPLPVRRQIPAEPVEDYDGGEGKGSFLKKMAPGIAGLDGGPYTPPASRKVTLEETNLAKRSGSFGDIPSESTIKNPAVTRAQAHNAVTGSTHTLTLTDDFDKEFEQISQWTEQPDLLTTNLGDQFNWQEVAKFTDDPSTVDDTQTSD